jgi:hypothetical protein
MVLDVPLTGASWYVPLRSRIRLEPGELAPSRQFLTIPEADARALLRSTQRLVADLPLDAAQRVVWQQGRSELLVDLSRTTLSCKVGLVTVTLTVLCDQVDGPATVAVPFAVGTEEEPNGLVMSTFSALDGPQVVVSQWTEAITAFAWETLIELARRLCADLGHDAAGRPLVPGAIGSGSRVLLVQPMARHELSALRG